MHYSWELKYIYIIKFLSLLSLKKYFLFLSFSLSLASLLSSFFLLNFFFSPSSTLCFADLFWRFIFIFIANLFWVCLHCQSSSSSSSSIFIFIAHVTVPRCQPISPSPPSHRSPNANKPSPPSHRRSKLHCWPKLHRWSKLHRHRLHRTQEHCKFHGFLRVSWWRFGWVSWWLSFVDQWWCGYVGGDLCGGFWLIWILDSGCGWLFLVC